MAPVLTPSLPVTLPAEIELHPHQLKQKAYACEISNPRPAGVPVSFAPGDGHATPDVHLHQHNQQVRQEVHLHGVDSATHSQALAAAHLAQAQAQSFVQSATTEAQNYVHNAQQEAMSRAAECASKLRDEAENQVIDVT